MEVTRVMDVHQLCGLKVSERALLFTLQQAGGEGISVSDAAQLMQWQPYYTGQVLRSLLDKGLVHLRKYGNFRLYSL